MQFLQNEDFQEFVQEYSLAGSGEEVRGDPVSSYLVKKACDVSPVAMFLLKRNSVSLLLSLI